MSVYLDHAATTPVRPVALTAFEQACSVGGNPSSVHANGRAARRVLEESRESIAADLRVRPGDVVFTSGGTEADNAGVKGLYLQAISRNSLARRILLSPTEHAAVLDSAQWLATYHGALIEWIPVDQQGVVDLDWLTTNLAGADDIALVAVMWANNETGVIAPIEQIAKLCAEAKIPLHSDAVQAATVNRAGDWLQGPATLAFSGHKFGAPIGIGAMIVNQVTPVAVSQGGGQEIKIRSGTVPVALAASMAAALHETRIQPAEKTAALRNDLEARVKAAFPEASVNAQSAQRLPGISSINFPGASSEVMLMLLDNAGISCSAGSACSAGVHRPSHVLSAMGLGDEVASSSLRFSVGWNSVSSDIDALLAALPNTVDRAKLAQRRSV